MQYRPDVADASVVHKDIQVLPRAVDMLRRAFALVLLCHIECDELGIPDFRRHTPPGLFVAVRNKHMRTGARERLRNGRANA